MRATIIIARKELSQRLRDRTFFILGIAAPLVLAFIFNLILGEAIGPGSSLSFDYGVVDEGGDGAAAGFEQMLGALEEEGIVSLQTFESAAEAQTAVDDGNVDAAFVLPATLSQGFGAEIVVLANVDAEIGGAVATAIAEEFARRAWVGAVAIRAGFDLGVIAPADVDAAIAEAASLGFPLGLDIQETPSRQVETTTFFIAGLGIFFTFFIVGLSLTSMLEERTNGTLSRLVAAPIRPAAIVAGKALASVVLGIIAMFVLVIASTLIMGADWGNLFAVAVIIVATVIAAAGLMAFVGGLARTAEQAGNLQSIVALTMAMLGGTFVPIAAESGILNTLRYMTPNAWYISGLGDIAGGAYGEMMLAVGVLLAIGAIFGIFGLMLVRRVVQV